MPVGDVPRGTIDPSAPDAHELARVGSRARSVFASGTPSAKLETPITRRPASVTGMQGRISSVTTLAVRRRVGRVPGPHYGRGLAAQNFNEPVLDHLSSLPALVRRTVGGAALCPDARRRDAYDGSSGHAAGASRRIP